jgi:hypothetical protein
MVPRAKAIDLGMARPPLAFYPASARFLLVADRHLTSGLIVCNDLRLSAPLIDGSTPHAAPLPGLESSSMGNRFEWSVLVDVGSGLSTQSCL